jgi:A/G-specific adenine glycosylase
MAMATISSRRCRHRTRARLPIGHRDITATILRTVSARPRHEPERAAADLAVVLVDWYRENGRDLAFRRSADPYAVLVSEAMAQQTQAERAAAYWERFMTRFPTIDALAQATPADVLREWQGLGYDRRALALWRAARTIRDEYDGRVPDSIDELERLPGVGPYTARAVAAIAFGQGVGAVDVNVRRVLGRVIGGTTGIPHAATRAAADAGASAIDPATWTHAVMDLGATVCRPRDPRCDVCPARPFCRYPLDEPHATVVRATPMPPFPTTSRWLRGRILDRLREARAEDWVALDGPIGGHTLERVHAATEALASEGMVEIGHRSASAIHARLALA